MEEPKVSCSVRVPEHLRSEAKRFGINISQVSVRALEQAVAERSGRKVYTEDDTTLFARWYTDIFMESIDYKSVVLGEPRWKGSEETKARILELTTLDDVKSSIPTYFQKGDGAIPSALYRLSAYSVDEIERIKLAAISYYLINTYTKWGYQNKESIIKYGVVVPLDFLVHTIKQDEMSHRGISRPFDKIKLV